MKSSRRRRKRDFGRRQPSVRRSPAARKRIFVKRRSSKAVLKSAGNGSKQGQVDVSEGGSRRVKGRVKIIFALFIIAALALGSFAMIEIKLKPALSSAAEIKTREFIEKIVMNSVYTVTAEEVEPGGENAGNPSGTGTENTEEPKEARRTDSAGYAGNEIIRVRETETGSISFVTLNTTLLNKIGTRIAKIVNEGVSENTAQSVRISLGSLFGSRLLSQFTPYLKFDIIPVAVSDVSYTTEFESVGINQTKYKVYMNVNTEAKILVPFMPETITTESTVLIAEAVIVGEVPETYANIPEDTVYDFVS